MGRAISEQIIAKTADLRTVQPADAVICNVDRAMIRDSSGARRVKGNM